MTQISYTIEGNLTEDDKELIYNYLEGIKGVRSVQYNPEKIIGNNTEEVKSIELIIVTEDSLEIDIASLNEILTNILFIRKTTLLIEDPNGTVYEIKDNKENKKPERLFDLFVYLGIHKHDLIKKWYRSKVTDPEPNDLKLDDIESKDLETNDVKLCEHMAKNPNMNDDKLFELCEHMAQNGYVIMIREEPSKKNGKGYNNIRLYFPKSYEQFGKSILINQIIKRLNPLKISKNGICDLKSYTVTIYKGNELMINHQQLVDFYIINHIMSTNIYENVLVVTSNGNIFYQQKSDNEGYKKLLAEINELDTELIKEIKDETNGSLLFNKLSKGGSLVLGFVDNSFLSDSNQKALYIPKDILEGSKRWSVLKDILKKYESMRKSNISIPDNYTISIYVDGVFFKKLRNDSYNWNGPDDYLADTILKEIKKRLDKVNAKESR